MAQVAELTAELAALKQQEPVGWTSAGWLAESVMGRNGMFYKDKREWCRIPIYLDEGAPREPMTDDSNT